MENIPGTPIRAKDKSLLSFWHQFWDDYCEITHFHGFHEMRTSSDWSNKIFWIVVIFLGFCLSLTLTLIGVLNFINDPVDTHVTVASHGKIDLPVLYCPQNWIDNSKISPGTEKYLLYALSYLRIVNYVYIPYDKMEIGGSDNLTSFVNIISLQMAIYLYDKTPPPYYVGKSRLIVSSFQSLSDLFINSDDRVKLINDMYPIYLLNQREDLFKYVYYNLTFNYWVVSRVYYQENETDNVNLINSLGLNQDNCFTLNDVEQISSGMNLSTSRVSSFFSCHENLKIELNINITYWSKIVHREQMFFKLFRSSFLASICYVNDTLLNFMPDSYCSNNKHDQEIRMDLEMKRSKRMIKLINEDERIEQLNNSTGEHSIRNYLEKCCSSDEKNFYDELKSLVAKAERKFLAEEKLEFDTFLKSLSFDTPLDYLKNVSFDESDFLVTFSVDQKIHIPPKSSNITSKRIVMAEGTCILFRIQLDANVVGNFTDDTDDVPHLRSGQYPGLQSDLHNYNFSPTRTAYMNIVLMQNGSSMFSQRESTVVSFGESAFAKSQNSFDLVQYSLPMNRLKPDFTDFPYANFVIDTILKVNAIPRSVTPCKERDLDDDYESGVLPYSFSNCQLSCNDLYSNPKMVCYASLCNGNVCRENKAEKNVCRELTSCIYLAENDHLPDGMEFCSFFNLHPIYESWIPKKKTLATNDHNKLECCNECFPPCQLLTFRVKNSQINDNVIDFSVHSSLSLKNVDSQLSYIAKNLTKQNELFWMPLDETVSSYLSYASVVARNIYTKQPPTYNRIEIVINTEVTTFDEQPSFTWDTFFGVVGGQIGLVMGASCLTLIQLLWLFTSSFYRYLSGKTRSVELNQEDGSKKLTDKETTVQLRSCRQVKI